MRDLCKLTVAVVALTVIAACASAPKGPTDEELVAQLVTTWTESVTTKNVEQAMSIVSDKFSSADAADKAAWKSYLEWVIASGYLDGATVDTSGTQTTIEGATAKVGPLVLSTAAGVFNLDLSLAKEADGWKVVSSAAR